MSVNTHSRLCRQPASRFRRQLRWGWEQKRTGLSDIFLKINAVLSHFIIQSPQMSIIFFLSKTRRFLRGNSVPTPSPIASSIVFHTRVKIYSNVLLQILTMWLNLYVPCLLFSNYLTMFIQIYYRSKEHEGIYTLKIHNLVSA